MFRRGRTTTACCALLLGSIFLPQVSGAERQPADEELPEVILSSVPQPEPSPPLKYMLVPKYSEMKPGNAATSYYRAILLIPRDKDKRFGEKQDKWRNVPLDQFPKEQAREWLSHYQNALKEVRVATYREHCNWDRRVRELSGVEAFSMLLPEIQECRELARVLRIKSRGEIAGGRFDEAARTLVDGYQLAANLSGSSMLITDLVAVACASIMNESVIDWIDADGPNLYWALASLPRPLVDVRNAIQQEMNFPLQMFPFMEDPESLSYTPQQWRQVIGDALQQMTAVSSDSTPPSNLAYQTAATGLILSGYSNAKQALIDEGMDPELVEAMPVGKVIAIRTARVYREVYQESIKWTFIPYSQSYRQMAQSIKKLKEKGYLQPGNSPGILPVAALLLPAIEPATLAPVRMQRDVAALQTIEALRRAAADNDGQLPATLTQLEQSPPPLDPVTGQPFIYKLDGTRFVLELPPPAGRPGNFGKRYEVTLSQDN